MSQRTFSILVFVILAAAMLSQCGSSQPQEQNTTLSGAENDGTPNSELFDAVSVGSIDSMAKSVAHGANLNARNAFSWTPLMIAAFYDQENAVRWLIKRGADVNASSDSGMSALLTAARVGDQTVLDDLIAAGCDFRAVDQMGRNALIEAVEGVHGASVLRDLLARGLAPDLPDADGQTPLMEAASCGNVQLAAILLKYGANLHAKDHAGRTPLELAQMAHDDPMIAFLRAH